jgi:sulfatase modifying factor 1
MPEISRNSIGIELVGICPGAFLMGRPEGGDYDERPLHSVHIVNAFLMSATPITNAQYELFDPAHKALRGKRGFSLADDEAVVFVSWHEAVAFCKWLSNKESKLYEHTLQHGRYVT